MEFWSMAIEVYLPFEYVVSIGYNFNNGPCVANRFISLITIQYIGALKGTWQRVGESIFEYEYLREFEAKIGTAQKEV
jgi:hypothetical protein